MPDQPSTTARKTRTIDMPSTIASEPLSNDDFMREATGSGIPDLGIEQPKSKAETELILKSLTKTYTMVAQFISLVSIQDGITIASNVDDLIESWRQLLDDDPKLRKRMMSIVKSSGWGAVISAHLVVAVPIAMNHRDSFEHLIKRKNDGAESNS